MIVSPRCATSPLTITMKTPRLSPQRADVRQCPPRLRAEPGDHDPEAGGGEDDRVRVDERHDGERAQVDAGGQGARVPRAGCAAGRRRSAISSAAPRDDRQRDGAGARRRDRVAVAQRARVEGVGRPPHRRPPDPVTSQVGWSPDRPERRDEAGGRTPGHGSDARSDRGRSDASRRAPGPLNVANTPLAGGPPGARRRAGSARTRAHGPTSTRGPRRRSMPGRPTRPVRSPQRAAQPMPRRLAGAAGPPRHSTRHRPSDASAPMPAAKGSGHEPTTAGTLIAVGPVAVVPPDPVAAVDLRPRRRRPATRCR